MAGCVLTYSLCLLYQASLLFMLMLMLPQLALTRPMGLIVNVHKASFTCFSHVAGRMFSPDP